MPLRPVFAPLVAVLLIVGGPRPAAASQPRLLPDSTTAESWTLANGLRVHTLHVPGARAVSIAVGFRFGQADDPAGQTGRALVLGELLLTSAAGVTPERTREELPALRPLGSSFDVGPHLTLLTEAATPAQFPGVLRQSAARMRGVTATEAGLRRAITAVRERLEQRRKDPARRLQQEVADRAAGRDPVAPVRGLERLTLREARQALAEHYVPANAVLAIAGNLDGSDFHALIEREFAPLPPGRPRAGAGPAALRPDSATAPHAGLAAPAGVVGVFAPALADTLHPSFYLSMLLFGTQVRRAWGAPEAGFPSRFQYALLEEPELVRFHPKLGAGTRGTETLDAAMREAAEALASTTVTFDDYAGLAANVSWILGGPMPSEVLRSARREPASMNLVATQMAARGLWGDDAFWAEYRRRMDPRVSPGYGAWLARLTDTSHQVRLLLLPDAGTAAPARGRR